MTDNPHYRTLVTFEVLTTGEAFNGPWEMLTDADSVALVDRPEPEEVSPAVFQRLTALHEAPAGTGWDISVQRNDTAIIDVARSLASVDGENPEYDRALVEMTADLIGLAHQYADTPDATAITVLGRPIPKENAR